MPTILDPVATALSQAQAAYAAETSARDATEAALEAQIADLKAQLAAKDQKTTFGFDISALGPDANLSDAKKIADHKALLGLKGVQNVRVFFGSDVPRWNDSRLQALGPDDGALISTLSRDGAGQATFLANTPDKFRQRPGQIKLAHGHERDANLLKSSNPAAAIRDWLDGNQQKADLLDAAEGYSTDDLVKITLYYSQTFDAACKNTRERFYGDQNFGIFGEDCYHPQQWLNQQDRYATPEELFGGIVAFCKQIGRPCAIPEWGGTLSSGDTDGSRRAQAIKDGGAYLRANGVLFANWWCATGSKDSSQPGGYRNHHLEIAASNVAAYKSLYA